MASRSACRGRHVSWSGCACLGRSDCEAWPDSNPDLAPVENGRPLGWPDSNAYDLAAEEISLVHSERRGRHNVAIGFGVGDFSK